MPSLYLNISDQMSSETKYSSSIESECKGRETQPNNRTKADQLTNQLLSMHAEGN